MMEMRSEQFNEKLERMEHEKLLIKDQLNRI